MSTTRLTFGTALSAVTDTVTVISKTANVVTKSVGMLDAYVDDASHTQRMRIAYNRSSLNERLKEEANMADTQRQLKIKEFLSNNPEARELWEQNQIRLQAVEESLKAK